TGMAVESLSRLETGALTNPTWKTLGAYAAAVGRRPRLAVEVAGPAPDEAAPPGEPCILPMSGTGVFVSGVASPKSPSTQQVQLEDERVTRRHRTSVPASPEESIRAVAL